MSQPQREPSGVREGESENGGGVREHTLAVLVENKPGVLSRVSGLFTRRGFNIDSLAVGETENPNYSRMTIVVRADDKTIEQVSKQLNRLIEVIKVSNLTEDEAVERELAMIKVSSDEDVRSEIMQITDIFRATVVDVGRESLVVEVTGDSDKIEAIVDMLRQFGIREMVRTGKISLARGPKTTKAD